MPIRALKNFRHNADWPLVSLKNTKIAVDGNWFIRLYFDSVDVKELVADIDGYVSRNLKGFLDAAKDLNFLWIWDGLNFKKDGYDPAHVLGMDIKNVCENKKFKFGKSAEFMELLVNPINKMLHDHNIDFCRAPYGAIAQCVYFWKKQCVDYIFTKTDAFLYKDIDRIITDFNFKTSMVCFFDKSDFEQGLKIKRNIFQHFLIASGCEYCATIPDAAEDFNVDYLRSLFGGKSFNGEETNFSTYNFEKYLSKYEEYRKKFYNAQFMVKYHPVMKLTGRVEPLDTLYAPKDLHKIFGMKLPALYYEMLFDCRINTTGISQFIFDDYMTISPETNEIIKKVSEMIYEDKEVEMETKFILDNLKMKLNLSTEHYKEAERTLELTFLHFFKNKSNMCNTLQNCVIGKTAMKENLVVFETEGQYLEFLDVRMFFVLREYLNWIKMYHILGLERSRSDKLIENYYMFDLTLKYIIPCKNKGCFNGFLAKHKCLE